MADKRRTEEDHLTVWLEAASCNPVLADETRDEVISIADRFRRVKICLDLVQRVWPDESGEKQDGSVYAAARSNISLPVIGRFQVLREIGRGGHAVVYLAEDPVLRRQVALKVPRSDVAISDDEQQRFSREARAVATLSHPNVVQVFDAGIDGDTRWIASSYYADGSLADWLKDQDEPTSASDAARFCAVLTDAVHYVHQQGILHRDLKPSNILLDRNEFVGALELPNGTSTTVDGQSGDVPACRRTLADITPKISDFGLAKFFEGQQDRTATGAILGTPAYMAPEQAEGRHDDVGAAADVYAIGAILYELLVGKPPFQRETELDTLRELTSRQATPPRKLCCSVPRDLEAICLRCLEFTPKHRYTTAGDLSKDLNNYLTGSSIHARPTRNIARLLKWSQRKPLVAGLTFALGLAILVGMASVTWQWQQARRHHVQSQRNFRRAHQALQEIHALVYEGDKYDSPDFNPLRKDVVQLALKYYKQFQSQDMTDLNLREDIAIAYRDIGFVAHGSGSQTEALELYRKSLALWEQLTEARPDHNEYWYFLTSIQTRIAQLHIKNQRLGEALPLLNRAMEVHQLAGHGDTAPSAVASTLNMLREVYQKVGREADAIKAARRVVSLRRRIASENPGNAFAKREKAGSYVYLASAFLEIQRYYEAIAWCERARLIQEELAGRQPEVPYAAPNLAHTLGVLGDAQNGIGQMHAALASYQQACEILDRVQRRHPSNLGFQRKLAQAFLDLGGQQRKAGMVEAATRSHGNARDLLQPLVAGDPQSVNLRFLLAKSYVELGRNHLSANRPSDAMVEVEAARCIFLELADEQSDNQTIQKWLERVTEEFEKAAS